MTHESPKQEPEPLCGFPIHPWSLAITTYGKLRMLPCVLKEGHGGEHMVAVQCRTRPKKPL